MARQIKETPVLQGQDAANFLREADNAKKPVSTEERARMKSNYEFMRSISKF